MKYVFAVLLCLIFSTAAPAAHGASHVLVTIHGLVCDFCARSLEKVFLKKDSVAAIRVDLDTKIVTIDLKNDMNLEDKEIQSGVTDAGYTIVKIERN